MKHAVDSQFLNHGFIFVVYYRHGSDENTLRGSEALTLDAIRSGVRFQRSIAEAWIKVCPVPRKTKLLIFDFFFFLSFFVGHIHMSYFGGTDTPVLDFW